MGVCACQLLCCPTRTPRKLSRTVTEPRATLQGLTFWDKPWPAPVTPGTLWQVSWVKQVFQAQATSQSSCRNGSVHSAKCAHSESCKYTQFVKHTMIKTPMPKGKKRTEHSRALLQAEGRILLEICFLCPFKFKFQINYPEDRSGTLQHSLHWSKKLFSILFSIMCSSCIWSLPGRQPGSVLSLVQKLPPAIQPDFWDAI